MGAVLLAWDEVRQQDVALKRAFEQRPDALLRFKREFRVVEQLRHPNLVRVFELGEDAEGLYFTMEVIDGEELDWWCQEAAPGSCAAGRPEEALSHLERAEAAAARMGQPIDLAIARYQRGRRLGGDEGDALIAAARGGLEEVGASERMLEEDVGLRG